MRRPPAASRRCPPNPKISAAGSRRCSSTASAPAYRSPDASPQEIMIRIAPPSLGSECATLPDPGALWFLFQRGRHEIELVDRNDVEVGEPDASQLVDERLRVADE